MSGTPLNIISPKALEKQLKVVESRMQVLQGEMAELEKIKEACLILMGGQESSENAEGVRPSAPAKRTKKKVAPEETEERAESAEPALPPQADSAEPAVVTH